jgi:SAM-dependent methyltransferase
MDTPGQTVGWRFDEFAHAGHEHLDPAYVAAYDHKAGNDPSDDLALLRQLGLDNRSALVDLGAGTGTFAIAAAPFSRTVFAVDVSSAMLAVLRRKVAHLGVTNVTPVRAGFLTYEHPHESADFVYSRNALHHLPDFWKAVAIERVAAMLRPGGILRLRDLIFSFAPGDTTTVLEAWLASGPDEAGRRLDPRGARDAPSRRAQHLQLGARSDARALRIRHRRGDPWRIEGVQCLHGREALRPPPSLSW